MSAPASLLVLNPTALAGPVAPVWRTAEGSATAVLGAAGVVETRGDGHDVDRIARTADETRATIVVAAGGDGTVGDVVTAIMRLPVERRPALAILPLGTANNVARSLGLASVRTDGTAAVELTLAAVAGECRRPLDVARTGERHFVGSLALGMDADILALRNDLRRRYRLGRRLGGYPLYLWSCAVNVLARDHGCRATLTIDGVSRTDDLYNLLVTNTAIYAGEFMFDDGHHPDDGTLDLLTFASAGDYVARYARAWRRHVGHGKGHPVAADRLERARRIEIELARPLPVQMDGEEFAPTNRLTIDALSDALTVIAPRPATLQRERDGGDSGERAYG